MTNLTATLAQQNDRIKLIQNIASSTLDSNLPIYIDDVLSGPDSVFDFIMENWQCQCHHDDHGMFLYTN